MDKKTLARKMLELSDLMLEVKKLQDEITPAILDLERSQEVGDIKATYYSGRSKTDYQQCVVDAEIPEEELHHYTRFTIDFKRVCEDKGLKTDGYKSQMRGPYVTYKVVD